MEACGGFRVDRAKRSRCAALAVGVDGVDVSPKSTAEKTGEDVGFGRLCAVHTRRLTTTGEMPLVRFEAGIAFRRKEG